jgi:MFS transporter, UMF1 family
LQTLNKKEIFSWTLYDFANSSFTTLVVTFIYSTYFTKSIAQNEIDGSVLWAQAVTISALLIALFSPVMGALADKGNLRKQFLFAMTLLCVVATSFLYTAMPGQVIRALFLFIIANFAFEMGMVFYNAYLPDIAPITKIGRVSGYGWSLGYIGGLGCLVLALIGFVDTDTPWFGFSTINGENIRATNFLVAAWFAVFSIPLFLFVKNRKERKKITALKAIEISIVQVISTFREISDYKQIFYFLLARVFYNDGLITIFSFGGIYAAGTFGFSFSEILIFGIVLNITAGLGAFIFGFMDDKLGSKLTIQVSNIGLLLAVVLAVLSPSKELFWVAGILVGIFSGPNQAASRSLMARFVPNDKKNEFYGFFAFSGKATTFAGPLLFGFFTDLFASQRVGISVIIFFFLAGIIILSIVNEKEGLVAHEK